MGGINIVRPGEVRSRGKVAKTSNDYKDVMVESSGARTSRRGKTAVTHTEEHDNKVRAYVYPTSSVETGLSGKKNWSKTRGK